MRVLICGGGVIGASIAYFLSCRGVAATVIERTEIACAASGKAGGFLALDWCDGTPLEALARRSFALHAGLAAEIGGDWGYRRLTTYGGSAGLDGLPLIGPVPGVEGAYLATGHSVWGILNAPATGDAIAELIIDGAARSVDLSAFDPARLPPFGGLSC